MRELNMDIEWRTVQLFMDNETGAISEVSIDPAVSTKVKCDCAEFQSKVRCKHSKFVREYMEEHDGHFSLFIPEEIDEEEAIEAMMTPEGFRNFVIRYGKVEVL